MRSPFLSILFLLFFPLSIFYGCKTNNYDALPVAVPLEPVKNITSSSLELKWQKNRDKDFTFYRIYRQNTPGVTTLSTMIAEITEQDKTEFKDNYLIPGMTYYYRVFVYDKSGKSNGSNEMKATTLSPWTVIESPNICNDWGLRSVSFPVENEGWAAGFNYTDRKGLILHYKDSVWKNVSLPDVDKFWELTYIDFPSVDDGWAVGYVTDYFYNVQHQGVILHYKNGIWENLASPISEGKEYRWIPSSISFPSKDDGWIVGTLYIKSNANGRGVALHFENGVLKEFKLPSVSSNWSLSSVHFISPDYGWAVGSDIMRHKGLALNYINGEWKQVSLPNVSQHWVLSSVHFISNNEGWIVGTETGNNGKLQGIILYYKNGNWELTRPIVENQAWWNLMAVKFVSPNEGWAIGRGIKTVLLYYRNGKWNNVRLGEKLPLGESPALDFTSPQSGWAVGVDGEAENRRGILVKYQRN